MKLDKKEVLELAGLARLELSDDQAAAMVTELSKILTVFQSLDDIDVTSMGEVDTKTETSMSLRVDEVVESLAPEALGTSAPEWDEHMFVVPKIVSKDG